MDADRDRVLLPRWMHELAGQSALLQVLVGGGVCKVGEELECDLVENDADGNGRSKAEKPGVCGHR